MNRKKIGEIALDTGVLVIGDINNIKKFKQDSFKKQSQLRDTVSGKIYEYNVDFKKYDEVLFNNMTVNELIEKELLEEIRPTNDTDLSTENIINDIDKGHKQLHFDNGVSGKAMAYLSNAEEGNYPVYIEIGSDGTERLVIEFKS